MLCRSIQGSMVGLTRGHFLSPQRLWLLHGRVMFWEGASGLRLSASRPRASASLAWGRGGLGDVAPALGSALFCLLALSPGHFWQWKTLHMSRSTLGPWAPSALFWGAPVLPEMACLCSPPLRSCPSLGTLLLRVAPPESCIPQAEAGLGDNETRAHGRRQAVLGRPRLSLLNAPRLSWRESVRSGVGRGVRPAHLCCDRRLSRRKGVQDGDTGLALVLR